MTDFLLELRSEEIPARMQAGARADLEKLFTAEIAKAGLKALGLTVYSTPRRLALIARGLPDATEAVSEEAKGPPEGAPDQAIEGFCRKSGVTRDQLELRDVKGRMTYFAVIATPGRATADVLAETVPAIIRAFPWPKSQRWGEASRSTESLKWVRPLSGIIALFGDDLVPLTVDGIASGRTTTGHRFHHSGEIPIANADDYAGKLRAAHVIIDHEERQNIIRDGAAKAAADAGLALIEDEGLVIENAGLTEWPVPLLGRFDASFLDVPPEVIQLTARVNQKYFVCKSSPFHGEVAARSADGGGAQSGASAEAGSPLHRASAVPLPASGEDKLANAFVCTANIAASDGGVAIVAGNEKVLAARLSDAKFFWELDQKTPLAEHAKKLENIVFHEKLGTVADKVERVAKLAEWLVSVEGNGLIHADPEQTRLAARLCKADLVTEMVGEFPELQGVMGGYYAEKEGLAPEIANAIRDHYKPVGQGDDVPTDPVTVAVSLADKLDTLVGFFAIGEKPTGSKDPFALRRAALGILSLIVEQNLRIGVFDLTIAASGPMVRQLARGVVQDVVADDIHAAARLGLDVSSLNVDSLSEMVSGEGLGADVRHILSEGLSQIPGFFVDRLKVQQREAGVRHDLIDAVFALGGEDDLVRLLARVKALQAFVGTDEGTNLLAGYKRAANILKSPPERGGGSGAAADGGGESSPSASVPADNARPLHHPADGPPPRSGEELALLSALDTAEPKATAAIEAEDFEGAMAALASLRAPIDAFFDGVMVNDPDPDKRAFRLGLLARFRDAVHKVADFSKIEG